MTKFLMATALAASLAIGGCATRANSVAPVAVSSSDYATLSCEQMTGQLRLKREQQIALERRQNNAAVADAAGVFLILVPLGSVFGADVSGNLAQVKGEVLALERAQAAKCGS